MKKYFVIALALLCLLALASCEVDQNIKTELHVPSWAIGTYKSDDNHIITVSSNGFVIDGRNVIPSKCRELQESEDTQTYGVKQYTVAFVTDKGGAESVGIASSKYATIIAYVHASGHSTYTCSK